MAQAIEHLFCQVLSFKLKHQSRQKKKKKKEKKNPTTFVSNF
jgi:hypothetical protein